MTTFPETRWTLIRRIQHSPDDRAAALDELLRLYWPALYAFARRRGLDPEGARDAVQGFVARLLEHDHLAGVGAEHGRLRGFLAQALRRYLADLHDHATAGKRGGGIAHVAVEDLERELPSDGDPERALIASWARSVMQRGLAALVSELPAERAELVHAFFGEMPAPSYQQAAQQHAMSVPQLKSFLHRARRRYGELVRNEVADTVSSEDEIEDELRGLVEALR